MDSIPVVDNPLREADVKNDSWKDAKIAELELELAEGTEQRKKLENVINDLHTELDKLQVELATLTSKAQDPETRPVAAGKDAGKVFERIGDPLSADVLGKVATRRQAFSKKTGISAETFDMDTVMSIKLKFITKDSATREQLESAIRRNPMLGKLDTRQIRDIVSCMDKRNIPVGESLIVEGDEGRELFISATGTYEVNAGGRRLDNFGSWTVFGEVALLYGCQRTASVTVLSGNEFSDATVWFIDRHTFQVIMLRTGMLRQQQNLRFVKKIPFFSHLHDKEEELLRLVDALNEEHYLTGEYVFRQGTIGETFYIVQEGQLDVIKEPSKTSGDQVVLATLHAGDTFGERALQSDDIRTASIKAVNESILFVISRRAFIRIVGLATQSTDSSGSLPVPPERIYDSAATELLPIECTTTNVVPALKNAKLKDFNTLGRLGAGGFGRVDLVSISGEKEAYALKRLSKKHIVQRKQQAHVFAERDIHKTIQHPFITRLYATFRDPCYLYMLMEPCLGGEMWCVLRQCGRLMDNEARFVVACVTESLAYLHRRHIIFRDLKPENLMLSASGYIKLIDFGFAKTLLPPAHKTWTFCGTPEYMAPEVILNKGHSFSVDLWAMGILIFELISGWPPFSSQDPMETYSKVLGGFETFRSFPAEQFPPAAKELLLSLCKVHPSDRLGVGKGENGVNAVRSHKWFGAFNWIALREQSMEPPIVPHLKGPTDLTNFDQTDAKKDQSKPPPDTSGWDDGF